MISQPLFSFVPDAGHDRLRATNTLNLYSLTLFVNRRERHPVLKSKGSSSDKLRKLDAVSPTRTLEDWWSRAKGPLLPSEGVEGDFMWYV